MVQGFHELALFLKTGINKHRPSGLFLLLDLCAVICAVASLYYARFYP